MFVAAAMRHDWVPCDGIILILQCNISRSEGAASQSRPAGERSMKMNSLTTASKRSPLALLLDCLSETRASYSRAALQVEAQTPLAARSPVSAVAWRNANHQTLSVFHVAKGRRRQARGCS